ncbi:Putative 4'-phosphopantetheinyl transferase [Picochlorum sp. SENEW3]|nr:Putative 4'-phosphopantetheinyl transferase [Picochlorum sp. SENEW3]
MPLVDDIDVRERTYTECRDVLHQEEVDELNAAIAQSSRGKQPVVDRLVARAYLRRVLAEYPTMTASPCDLVFSRNKHGKPELVCGDAPSPIRFNLTHTRGVVGVAVSTENAIGIDVEAQARETREMKLAQKYFSQDELAVLQDIPPGPERRSMFVRIWTLKEAYVKAIGRGIGAHPGMSSFGFVLDIAHQQIDFRPSDKEPCTRDCWFFQLVEPLPGYVGALCAEGGHTVHTFTTHHLTSEPVLTGHHMPLLAQSSPCHPIQ